MAFPLKGNESDARASVSGGCASSQWPCPVTLEWQVTDSDLYGGRDAWGHRSQLTCSVKLLQSCCGGRAVNSPPCTVLPHQCELYLLDCLENVVFLLDISQEERKSQRDMLLVCVWLVSGANQCAFIAHVFFSKLRTSLSQRCHKTKFHFRCINIRCVWTQKSRH